MYEREINRYNADKLTEEVLEYERMGGPLSLNEDQPRIYDSVVESLNLNNQQQEISNNLQRVNNLYFVDGPGGGCGKTHLYKDLLAYCRSKNAIALASASSGIDAALLPGGSPAHSMFKLPLHITEDSVYEFKAQYLLAKLL